LIPEERIFYLDESGFDTDMVKMYGFSKIGQRIMAEKSGNRKKIKELSVIAVRNHIAY
jgi:hypothetical protein